MNYEEMSDFEINKRVAIALRPFLSDYKCSDGLDDGEVCFASYGDNRTFNYLKWVNYAWPIIVDNQITIAKCDYLDFWEAYGGGYGVNYDHEVYSMVECQCNDKNPLRAAMICFLKMKDAENRGES